MNTPRFTEHDTSLHLWLDDPKDPAVEATRDKLIAHLTARGFQIGLDERVDQLIRSGYHVGRKGALEVYIETSGRSLKAEFFQNIVTENRNGGRFDFDKRHKMPFMIGKQYELERAKIAEMMAGLGYPLTVAVKRRGMDMITRRRDELNKFQGGSFYAKPPAPYNSGTATKGTVSDGDTVYFYNTRWQAGVAYHNINNMWWVLLPCGTVTNIASFDLRHTVPEEGLRGRHFDDGAREKKQMDAMYEASRKNDLQTIEVLRALLTPEHSYYVISLKHTRRTDKHITIWGQSGSGYRHSIAFSGKYDRAEILANLGHYNSGDNIAVDAETVERLVNMSDQTDRDLAGEPTLANTAHNWHRLLAATIATPKYEALPELFTTKSGKKRKVAA